MLPRVMQETTVTPGVPTTRTESPVQVGAEWALFAAGVLAQLFLAPHAFFADDIVRILTLESLLQGKGAPANFYSVVGPLFAAPLHYVDRLLGTGGDQRYWVLRFNVLVFVAGALGLHALLRRHALPKVSRRVALLLLLCSMFGHHFIYFYGEVFTAVMVLLGLALVAVERPLTGWTLAAVGVANTPALLVGLGLCALGEGLRTRRIRHAWGVVLALGLMLAENTWRRGGPFVSGYEGAGAGLRGVMPYTGLPGFSYPFVFGALSLLFSFGRGILFYAPGLWLVLDRKGNDGSDVPRRLTSLCLVFLLGMLLVYARWFSWHGAVFWGPRFFLFASVPAALLLASRLDGTSPSLRRNLFTLLALAGSAYVGWNGHVYRYGDVPDRICRQADGAVCLYAPEVSPLFVHWVFPKSFDTPMKVLTALGVLCFAVLGWRLCARAAVQAGAWLKEQWRAYGPAAAWRV